MNFFDQIGLGVVIEMVNKVTGPAKQMSGSLKRVGLDAENLRNSFGQMKQQMFTGMKIMAGGAMMAAPFVAATGAANKAHQAVHDFAELFVLELGPEGAIKQGQRLSDTIRDLIMASPVEHPLQDVRSAAWDMQSALQDVDLTLAALQPSWDAATAGMGTVTEATEVGTSVLKQYKDQWQDSMTEQEMATRTFDVLAAAVSEFKTRLPALAEGFKDAIPYAAKLGQSFEEFTAIIGTLQTQGLTGARAGTSYAAFLRGIIRMTDKQGKEVQKPVGTLTELLESFEKNMASGGKVASALSGIRIFDESGRLLKVVDILKQMEDVYGLTSAKATGALTELNDAAAPLEETLSTILPVHAVKEFMDALQEEGARAALMLIGQSEALEKSTKKVSELDAAQRMASIRREGATLSWKGFWNQLKLVTEEIGSHLMPEQMNLYKGLSDLAVKAMEWIQQNPELVGGLVKGALAFAGLTVAIGAATIAWAVLNAAFWATPIGPIVMILASVAAGLYLIVTHWDEIKSTALVVLTWLQIALSEVPDWLLMLVPPLLILKHWDTVWQGIKSFIGKIKSGIEMVWGAVKWLFDKISGAIDSIPGLGWILEGTGSLLGSLPEKLGITHAVETLIGSPKQSSFAALATPLPTPPTVTPPERVPAAGETVIHNSPTIHVHATPGMNEDDLARSVVRKMESMFTTGPQGRMQ